MKWYGIWCTKAKSWVEGDNRLPVFYRSKAAATRDLKDFAVTLEGYEIREFRPC